MQHISECQEYSTREQDTVWEQNPPALVPHEPRAHDEVDQRRYGKPQEKDRREVRGLKCERSAKTRRIRRFFCRNGSCLLDCCRFTALQQPECMSDHENEKACFRISPRKLGVSLMQLR